MVSGTGAGAGFMGFRPVLGGLRQGAGPAVGVGFEPFGRSGRTLLALEAIASVKKYWGVRSLAGYRGDPLVAAAFGQIRHMPKEPFFGIGSNSRLGSETTYRLNEADVGVLVGIQASPQLAFGVQGAYVTADALPPQTLDLQDAFARISALGVRTKHAAAGGWMQLDGRDPAPARRFFRDLSPLESGIERMPLATRRGYYALVEFAWLRKRAGSSCGTILSISDPRSAQVRSCPSAGGTVLNTSSRGAPLSPAH